ncbi:hypothetical protein [Acidianus bottle-shaped virus 3 strain ABV3]|uniref:Uncharacterized protein n=1 Tax=Acidianus bottle-shaped virus 3 strain ABV3 TaxID=1732174 RepID=A0A0N9P764_9VIRU|nr:hypothetical protein AVU00_gp61 [Acidianus bottle-shaped virus 3 strain ABV3]ALG96863.1 hypothetical protein [Acidianus bottle-shaped virus 3 strain ABV3]
MSETTSELLSELLTELTVSLFPQINIICSLLPPVFTNLVDVLINLPIILLYLITLPVRFFVCFLAQLINVSPWCLIFNLFPMISMVCPFLTASPSEYSCYGNCPYCVSSECVQFPPCFSILCTACKYSIFNKIFCDFGVVLLSMIQPLTVLINIITVPIFHKALCLNVNPEICNG